MAGTIKNGWYPGEKLNNHNVPYGVYVYGSYAGYSYVSTLYYDTIKRAFYEVSGHPHAEPEMIFPPGLLERVVRYKAMKEVRS